MKDTHTVKPLGCQRRPATRHTREQFSRLDINGLVLYRCYGLDGTLMYIGKTCNLQRRITQHRSETPWWFAVETMLIQRYRNRNVLHQDELRAINAEQPFFNQQGKGRRCAIVGTGHGVPLWMQNHEYDEVRRAENDMFVFPQFAG